MKNLELGKSGLKVPNIAIGCMRINQLNESQLDEYIMFCLENGLNFFDHADIYGAGECEIKFAKAIKNNKIKREDIIVQSKCGIRKGMYDFSKEHILTSVDAILKRLNTDYLDILVLHRPDTLVEPEEVAAAFDTLEKSGKVHHFGVSNHRSLQIELLKKHINQELLVNQLQFSLPFSNIIASGIEANTMFEGSIDRDGSILDYSRLNDMTIQAWSPFQYGFFEGVFIGSEKYKELNIKLKEIAEKYNTTETAIATSWILTHPAKMQMIAGTTKIDRLKEILQGSLIKLTREEWYGLYLAAGHKLP